MHPPLSSGRAFKQSRRKQRTGVTSTLLAFLASIVPSVSAQACIALSGSTQCPAFNASSVSTNAALTSLFPFLAFVSSTQQFDDRLSQYVSSSYVQVKYQQLIGCNGINLTNTTSYYARYTTSVICNAIVQNSIQPCSLSSANSRPLCADSCAQQATSEEEITMNSQLCGTPGPNAVRQIRADFTDCALPADSLSGSCVTIPASVSLPPLFPSSTSSGTPSATATNTAGAAGASVSHPRGLTGGQTAGIVVGSILGAALIIGLLIFCCFFLLRKRGSQKGSIFNQPSPKRRGNSGMVFAPQTEQQGDSPSYEVLPGGRITRMSALEHGELKGSSALTTPGVVGAAGASRRRYVERSDTDDYGDNPGSRGAVAPPAAGKRTGSLSSHSALGAFDDSNSPTSGSGGQQSSPEGVASGQSEQLPFFKDYYSQEEIHPNDKVATLWAYEPRATDEFELERGDMFKVVGIWDDGWATGVRINERAEDYDGKRKLQRDSGVSNGSGPRAVSPPPTGEIKAFPLVCVCLPEYWKQTIEGDVPIGERFGGLPPGIGS
ncbi:SH3 domain [Lasallia pustulata]|uniref:SH3 domain n=1 Tax=Lasallia pustulata TaxID=136370 RepID=A0A1W5DBI8_9LECA|nr:SH3 domain [Lasallia pustulata]